MIYPSALIPHFLAPSSPDDIWSLPNYFMADWTDTIKLESEFSTTVRGALSDSEDRISNIDKPYRLITVDLQALTKDDSLLLHDFLMRTSSAGFPFPVYCDQTLLLNTAPSTSLSCDASYRRFYQGGRVLIINPQTREFELGVLNSVSDSSLELLSPLTKTFSPGDYIFPIMECRADLSLNDAKYLTDYISTAVIKAQEVFGRMSLPAITQSVTEYPLFDFPLNWEKDIAWNTYRKGDYESIGKTKLLRAYGARPRHAYTIKLTFPTRSQAWEYIAFFNHRKGKLKPFWFPSPGTEFTYVSHTTSSVRVKAIGDLIDWENRPAIAIESTTGTTYARAISQVVRSSGDDILTLSSSLPSISIKEVRLCALARFDQDDIEEAWESTEVMNTKVKIVELLEEKTVNSSIQPIIPELA